jgi:hypothetical protein
MDGDYVFLCGVMWCKYGQQDAGKELLRAATSPDVNLSTLALAMFASGRKSLQPYAPQPRSGIEKIKADHHLLPRATQKPRNSSL